jgi:hypothetical protein
MKLMRFLVLALIISACAATASPERGMSGTNVGPVHFGMTVSDIEALGLPASRDQIFWEGDAYDRITLTVAERDTIEIILDGNRVGDIETASSSFATENGAKVGASLQELGELYPAGQINIGSEEGHYFNFETPDHGFFEFDTTNVPPTCFDYGGTCPDLGDHRSVSYRIRDMSPQ